MYIVVLHVVQHTPNDIAIIQPEAHRCRPIPTGIHVLCPVAIDCLSWHPSCWGSVTSRRQTGQTNHQELLCDLAETRLTGFLTLIPAGGVRACYLVYLVYITWYVSGMLFSVRVYILLRMFRSQIGSRPEIYAQYDL